MPEPVTITSSAVARLVRLLQRVPPLHLAALGGLMLIASLMEGAGLMLLVPLVAVIGKGSAGDSRVTALSQWLDKANLTLTVEGLLIAFVLLIGLRSLVQFLREQVGVRIERSLVDLLRSKAYAALLHAEWRWLAHSTRSDHAHVLLSNIDRLGTGLTHAIALAAGSVTLLVYAVVALWLAPLMAALVALSGAAVFLVLGRQRRRALELGRELSNSRRGMFASVVQGLAAIKLTKILGNEQRQLAEFDRNMVELRQQGLTYSASLGRSRALFQLGAALLLALYLYLGLTVWNIPAARLVTLIILFARAVPMLMALQQNLFIVLHAVPAMEEVDHLLAETADAAEAAQTEQGAWALTQELRLDQVSIAWPERSGYALDNVSLTLPARTTLAVTGPSGAGKSTLADVVMGLLMPDSGAVLIDGKSLGTGNRGAWRRAVAYVPQEVFLFNDTVRANLAWGLPEGHHASLAGSEQRMADALRQAGADFVFDLPAGLDTPVGDTGQRLSGGERQRIALARALLRRPSLLILDEATSALDIDNELRIRDAIDRLHGDLTVIVIGHRLPMLENADQIIRLEHGRISAQGEAGATGEQPGRELPA